MTSISNNTTDSENKKRNPMHTFISWFQEKFGNPLKKSITQLDSTNNIEIEDNALNNWQIFKQIQLDSIQSGSAPLQASNLVIILLIYILHILGILHILKSNDVNKVCEEIINRIENATPEEFENCRGMVMGLKASGGCITKKSRERRRERY